jgi:hypothetical protein
MPMDFLRKPDPASAPTTLNVVPGGLDAGTTLGG